MKINEALCFDDVLLKPQYFDFLSRKEISIASDLGGLKLELPIISAPMDTITECKMASAMRKNGGFGIIHRYLPLVERLNHAESCNIEMCENANQCGVAIGVNEAYLTYVQLILPFTKYVCVDVAHGDQKSVLECVENIKNKFGDEVYLIVGNVATYDGAYRLANIGADCIKVGIGGGSICSTRLETGHGMPTFQSILEVSRIKEYHHNVKLIADGGIKNAGDCVKALAAGADFVMLGSLLSGTEETPGEIIEVGPCGVLGTTTDAQIKLMTRKYKKYRGMASEEAQIEWKGSFSSQEGISTQVPFQGNVSSILKKLKTNITSGFSYSGVDNLNDLHLHAEFIKQTNAGQHESSTHILSKFGI